MTPSARRALNTIGFLLGAAGIAFVGIQLDAHLNEIAVHRFTAAEWMAVGALCLASAASCVLLAMAWKLLLARSGSNVAAPWAVRTYGITQLAKYVPGNVFQFAGRQGLGRAAGLPARSLALSTGFEIAFLVLASASYSTLLLTDSVRAVSAPLALAAFVAGTTGAGLVVRGICGPDAAGAFVLHVVFLAITGGVFASIVHLVPSDAAASAASWSYLVGAFVVAWVLGLLTPGAPAGLGVRELVLLALMQDYSDALVVQAVVLGRLVSMVGDTAFFGLAMTLVRASPCELAKEDLGS